MTVSKQNYKGFLASSAAGIPVCCVAFCSGITKHCKTLVNKIAKAMAISRFGHLGSYLKALSDAAFL